MDVGRSTMRCLEHIPVIGHIIAAFHACKGNRNSAERAALNATVGIILAPVNIVAEVVDEATRDKPERLKQSRLTPRPDWMRRHRLRSLRNICLPGSHQSATYTSTATQTRMPLAVGWTRCQSHDIREQLEAGVRFLDVGVTTFEGDIWCRAGGDSSPVAMCVRLRDVLADVRAFVGAHPTEIVAVHVTSGEGGGDRRASVDWNACQSIVLEVLRDKLVPEHMREMPIGDIIDQSRNVIVCGLPDAAFNWAQLQYRWPNKPSPGQLENHMRGTLQETGLYRPSCLFWYKAECTPSSQMYVRSVGGLTGLVAARHGGPEKFDSLEDLASSANSVVLKVLSDINMLPFNILTTDFIDDQIIGRILQLNELAERGQPQPTVNVSIPVLESEDDADDVFPSSQQLHTSHRLINTTVNSSFAPGNSSFDFRQPHAPPVQFRETTM